MPRMMFLDYGERNNPFGEIIGKRRVLSWPVDMFRVTLPAAQHKSELNPFEHVVLSMLDAGGGRDAALLAEEVCLPVDLTRGILLRLQDKGFIDKYNNVEKSRCEERKIWEKEDGVYVTAAFFRETATGRVLPFYHKIDDVNPLKKMEKTYDTKVPYDKKYQREPLTTSDVVSVLSTMRRRSLLPDDGMQLPSGQKIFIDKTPEQYYLHCAIAIQKSDSEFRIADPFGDGFSLVLEHAFQQLLERDSRLADWLMKWKRGLSEAGSNDHATLKSELRGDNRSRMSYPNLCDSLTPPSGYELSIGQIYGALEWALFYVNSQRPYNAALDILQFTAQSRHSELLDAAAADIGLNPPKFGFRAVPQGKLQDFHSGRAELWTLLAIAVLMAKEDAAHPLRRVANRYPDLIPEIMDIKKMRDSLEHGVGRAQRNEEKLPQEDFMREIVSLLLPSMNLSGTSTAERDKDASSDALLDARINIQQEFGFRLFNRLGMELQERMVYAERFWLSCRDGENANTFACDLYAALQAFFVLLYKARPYGGYVSAYAKIAEKKAVDAGLGCFSNALLNVKETLVERALAGNQKSLGACVVAFLLTSDPDDLAAVAEMQPTFVADVAEIIDRRGHGNESLPLTRNEVGKLRKSAYSTIKTLLEI